MLQDIIDYIDTQLEANILYAKTKLDSNLSEDNVLSINTFKELNTEISLVPIFSEIFTTYKLEKYGILHVYKTYTTHHDVSFYSCILTLLDVNYKNLSEVEQYVQCNYLIEYICGQLYGKQKKRYKHLNWKIADIIKDVKQYKLTKKIMQIVIDIFHINIFILSGEKKNIECYFCDNREVITGHSFNAFNKNMFIYNTNEVYEPIFVDGKQHLMYFHPIIKKIIKNPFLICWIIPEKGKKRKTDVSVETPNVIPDFIYSNIDYSEIPRIKCTDKNEIKYSRDIETINYLLDLKIEKNNI